MTSTSPGRQGPTASPTRRPSSPATAARPSSSTSARPTTFDVITADGAWCGGAIAPGIGISHDALVQRTARLHAIDLAPPPQPLGRNTMHAMQSGIFWGYVGLVEGLVERLRPSAGAEPRVIATGGLARLFSKHVPLIDVVAPLLALDGLRLIYERNV